MPVTVPTQDELAALQAQVAALDQRVMALETATPPPDIEEPPDTGEPPDGEPAPAGSMVVTITATETPYHSAGPFVFTEADAEDLGVYNDPAGRFVVVCKRARHDGCDLVIDFLHYVGEDTDAQAVVMQRGTADPANLNALNQVVRGAKFGPYSVGVSIDGEVVMEGETTEHYDGSEWRLRSWGPAENWPFSLTPVADLQAVGVVGVYDAELGAACCPPALAGMRYIPMRQSNGISDTPGYVCALRMGGGSTGVDSAIGLEGDEISAFLGGQPNMLGTVLEQAEAYHIYPWHRIDPATGAQIQTCGPPDAIYRPGQVFSSGYKGIGCTYHTTSQATITGPPGTVIPNGTMIVANNGGVYTPMSLPGSGGLPASGTFTPNVVAYDSPYLPSDTAATLDPPVAGCTVTLALDAYNTAEGIDGISLDINHMPNGGFLPFMLTGDPYHLKSVQAKASCTRAAQAGWAIENDGVAFVTKNGFQITSARCQAWFLRDIAEAVIATPDDMPRWLLPRSGFEYALREIRNGYQYRWDNPINAGGPATNLIETMANQTSAGSMYHDYLHLACIRALKADPEWTAWIDRHIRNLIDRFDPSSGWCNTIASWYVGLDFRACTSWQDAFAVLLAHTSYSGKQSSGAPGLTGCPTETTFYASGMNWNTAGQLVWTYAAMTRLKQLGYGGDAFHVAYDGFVRSFREAALSGELGDNPFGWKFCFEA